MARHRRRRRKRKDKLTFRDRLFVNLTMKLVVGLIVIVGFLTLSQCTIKKPQAPTWTTQFSVPLVNRTYDMAELVDRIDDPSLALDSAGDPFFSITEDVDSLGVDASMTVPTINQSFSEAFGAVQITGENVPAYTVAFADLATATAGVVPPASFDFVYDGPVVSNYSSVTVSNGQMLCPIDNNMGVPLDTVQVELIDLNTFVSLGAGSLSAPLPAGSVDTVIVPLNNKTISNRLRMQVHAHTPGGTVLTTSDKDITVDMDLSDPFTISSGSAIIPSIDKNFSSKAPLGSSHLIESATLESGSLSLTLRNSSLVSADLTVTLPDFKNSGAALTVARTLGPNSNQIVAIDLAGYTVEPSDLTLPQDLDVLIAGHIDSSGSSYVNFNENDSLGATAQVSNVSFSTIRGVFDSITTTFAPIAQAISVPNGFDSAQLTAATLTLEVDNGSALNGSLDLQIQGNNGQSLNLTGLVASGASSAPVTTAITETNLSSFLNPIPSSITVSGTATFGDGVTTTDVTKNDFVKARVRIESPLEVVFNGSTVKIDPESSDIDTSQIDLITNHLIDANLNATITNHLPAGLQVLILLSGDSATLYSAPQLTVGPINVAAGQLDSAGNTIGDVISDNVINLDSADVQVLNTDTLFIGEFLTIESTGGTPVRFRGTDYVTINATVSIEYKFNDDF